MVKHYYSCVPALAWILAHYFYNDEHFVWIAAEYYPYRLPNPKSSNPHLIYQDLYQSWKDRDEFDKTIVQARLNLRMGVLVHESTGKLTQATAAKLRDICDKVDIVFLCPIAYRVEVDNLDPARLHRAGSAVTLGSHEYLVRDLRDTEFDKLFVDFDVDIDFSTLVVDAMAKGVTLTAAQALKILEARS